MNTCHRLALLGVCITLLWSTTLAPASAQERMATLRIAPELSAQPLAAAAPFAHSDGDARLLPSAHEGLPARLGSTDRVALGPEPIGSSANALAAARAAEAAQRHKLKLRRYRLTLGATRSLLALHSADRARPRSGYHRCQLLGLDL